MIIRIGTVEKKQKIHYMSPVNTVIINVLIFLCTSFMTTLNNVVQMNTTLIELCPLGSTSTSLTQPI